MIRTWAVLALALPAMSLASESAEDIGLRALTLDFDQVAHEIPADRVLAMYGEACEAGWKPACDATSWTNGDAVRLDDASAYFTDRCESRDDLSCLVTGWLLTQQPLGTPSTAAEYADRGASNFRKLCEGRMPQACFELARVTWDGVGALRDKQRAAELFQQACDDNVIRSCKRSAEIMLDGSFSTADPEGAAERYQRACDVGDLESCNALGELYRAGQGVERDDARAQELFDRSCKRGEAQGCRNMALVHVAKADLKNTVHYYGLGCKAGDGTACADAGKMYASGATADPMGVQKAFDMFSEGCALGEPGACFDAAQLGEGKLAISGADLVRLYADGCENGGGAACGQIAHLTVYGKQGVSKDREEGIRLARRGCRAGDGWACYLTGTAYQRGWTGDRDWEQAAGAYQQACLKGVAQACGLETKARRKAGMGL